MRRISKESVSFILNSKFKRPIARPLETISPIEDAAELICQGLPIEKIVIITDSEQAVRRIAACAPSQPIIAVSNDPITARSFNILYGTEGIHIDITPKMSINYITAVLRDLWIKGIIHDQENILLISSSSKTKSGTSINLLQTCKISDLKDTLGWKD